MNLNYIKNHIFALKRRENSKTKIIFDNNHLFQHSLFQHCDSAAHKD